MKKLHLYLFIGIFIFLTGCVPATPPLHEAAYKGDVTKMQSLINNGAAIDEWYFGTPLIWAAGAGRLQSVKILVEHGADVNKRANKMGWTPLGNAVLANKMDVANYLVEKGADIDNALQGLNDQMEYCKQNGVPSCVENAKAAILRLQNMQGTPMTPKNTENEPLQ